MGIHSPLQPSIYIYMRKLFYGMGDLFLQEEALVGKVALEICNFPIL